MKREMLPGERVHVTPKTMHRMTAIEDSDIFEVSTPELHDVVRLEDRYGRQELRQASTWIKERNQERRSCLLSSLPPVNHRRGARRPY